MQYEEIADCILSVNPPVCDQVPAKCIPVCFLLPMFVGEQAQSLAVQIGLNVDPFEPDGKKWYENALDALGGVRAQHSSATFVLTAGASWRYDYVNDMYERLPWIVVATILVVVVFTGIVFSSIVIPVLLVCSMVVSIGPTLGAAVLYFASQPVGAMSWVIPVLTMPLLLGAVLDPDVQLLLKVVSFRSNNVPTRDSIACAVVSLFRVWFGNALFMTVMMVIWLFSEVEVIQMLAATLGTVFVWATLAVRPFFLPALLSLAGDWVWWPHMPPVVPTSPAEFSQHGAI